MSEWLVVVLQAPLASFADAPGNTTRKTGDMPARRSSGSLRPRSASVATIRLDRMRWGQRSSPPRRRSAPAR